MRTDAARRGPGARRPALDLRLMHGMLSAVILICGFGAIAAACAYVAGRVYLTGGRRGDPS
jgi:hypothetical protein